MLFIAKQESIHPKIKVVKETSKQNKGQTENRGSMRNLLIIQWEDEALAMRNSILFNYRKHSELAGLA